ncbi:MAG: formimidoylglutamase [Bacteroidales bacterium]|jgi:arginase family enzyme|nr:formimidoylglutamase [Bacteroidales bacterium]
MDLQTYLEPTLFAIDDDLQTLMIQGVRVFSAIDKFPDLEGVDMAIIGVPESRNAWNNAKCDQAPDIIREHFYALHQGEFKHQIADLGNIKLGQTPKDTYAALADIVGMLIDANILPIVLGGSQDLTLATYQAFAYRKQIINLFALDNRFDLGDPEHDISSRSYLSQIIVSQPNYLFTCANAGFQTYLVDKHAIELMKNLNFDAYRLGVLRQNIQDIEPVVRNADVLSVDISAVRKSDAPGNENAMPVGLFGEEASQIMRYAGMSEKMRAVGFYEYNPSLDIDGQTAQLIGIMLWCFVEGFYQRKNEFPYKDKDKLTKFIVAVDEHDQQVVFYKSKQTDRWWMEIPANESQRTKFETHYMVPCSYSDYEQAVHNELPDRWVSALARFV